MIVAVYDMPTFTTREDALAMTRPFGMALRSFGETPDRYKRAVFLASTIEDVNGLTRDLSYGPASVFFPLNRDTR